MQTNSTKYLIYTHFFLNITQIQKTSSERLIVIVNSITTLLTSDYIFACIVCFTNIYYHQALWPCVIVPIILLKLYTKEKHSRFPYLQVSSSRDISGDNKSRNVRVIILLYNKFHICYFSQNMHRRIT